MQPSIITLPDAGNAISSTTASATPLFQALLPIALLVAGLLIGGAVVGYFVGSIKGAAARVVGRGKRGGRRRRR